MRRNGKFGVGAAILVVAIGYLVYAGVERGSVYYFRVGEFDGRKEALAGQGIRVAGQVAKGSVIRHMTADGTDLRFVLGEFPAGQSGSPTAQVRVHYTGIVPDMFAEGRDVIVEGTYRGGTLEAHTLMTSCPSKYEAGNDGRGSSEHPRS